MNRDVFLSILALDSYNRGYGANLNGLAQSGGIGLAAIGINSSVLLDENGQRLDEAAGFYAIAYDVSNVSGFLPGDRVISYRGTNFTGGAPSWPDIWNGWTLGAGFSQASQGNLGVAE